MVISAPDRAFTGLSITGLALEHCHVIEGSLARIYFRLSGTPPLGWSYVFTQVWQATVPTKKRQAGVEADAIWLECAPEEIAGGYLEDLKNVVVQANEKFLDSVRQQALNAETRARLEAEFLSQLEDLNRTLYPKKEPVAPTGSAGWLRDLWAGFLSLFRRA